MGSSATAGPMSQDAPAGPEQRLGQLVYSPDIPLIDINKDKICSKRAVKSRPSGLKWLHNEGLHRECNLASRQLLLCGNIMGTHYLMGIL